jgi:hypothetical protein
MENDEVRNALHVTAVILENEAAREQFTQSFNQFCLVNVLWHDVDPQKQIGCSHPFCYIPRFSDVDVTILSTDSFGPHFA